jgi:hypothetical protein
MTTLSCVSAAFLELAQWAGREPLQHKFLVEIFEFLNSKGVTDEQLHSASASWRCKSRFFPCPQDLVNEVFLGSDYKALIEWTAIALSSKSDGPTEGLTDIGREALQAIGGRWAVNNSPSGIMRKQFLEMYGAIARQRAVKQVQKNAEKLQAARTTAALPSRAIDISGIGGEL